MTALSAADDNIGTFSGLLWAAFEYASTDRMLTPSRIFIKNKGGSMHYDT